MADLLTDRVVGLLDVQRDQAGGMPGQHPGPLFGRTEEVEHHTALGILAHLRRDRQTQVEQLRNQPAFGILDLPPPERIFRVVQIGNRLVQPAGATKRFLLVGDAPASCSRPANRSSRTAARGPPSGFVIGRIGELPGARIGSWFKRSDLLQFGLESERRRFAAQAQAVAKVDRPSADAAKCVSAARGFVGFPGLRQSPGNGLEDVQHASFRLGCFLGEPAAWKSGRPAGYAAAKSYSNRPIVCDNLGGRGLGWPSFLAVNLSEWLNPCPISWSAVSRCRSTATVPGPIRT